ncbi:MAG: alpha/beta fold hydrolase [Putridiphycobacter sp.]
MRKKYSHFKQPEQNENTFKNWLTQIENENGYVYDQFSIETSLGRTQIYGFNTNRQDLETLVIFPGFRTTTLIWDLDAGLKPLFNQFRVFMVETNGQPNLSEGYSPSIKSLDYGHWGAEVFEQLKIDKAFIAGASFGGLVCMKIALVIPEKIKSAFLLNPGCFRYVSFGAKNMFYNLLPLIKSSKKNIKKFLDKVVFYRPTHQLSATAENLLIDYLHLAITQYKDRTEKPYDMGTQLDQVKVDTHLLVGDQDILIPYEKSVKNAKMRLKNYLDKVKIFKGVGHGIECYPPAISYIEKTMKSFK